MKSDPREKAGEGQKKGNWTIITGIVFVIVLLIIIVILLIQNKNIRNQSESEEETKRNVVVMQNTVDAIVDDMFQQEYIAPGYFSASMSTTWHFASGDSVSEDAYVANLAENTNDIFFDIVLAENEKEVIYKSPVLPRGSELNQIVLDIALPTGAYDCIMIYHLVDQDQNTVSTLRIAFTIIVEG